MTTVLEADFSVHADPRSLQTAGRAVQSSPTATMLAIAAIAGPALLLASSVAWLAGDEHAELRGILQFWAFPFLAMAAVGVAGRLERPTPVGRAVVTALVLIGACAGAAFANEINMVEHFGIERLMEQDTPSAFLALGFPGPCFPVGLMALGALSFRHRTLPGWQAAALTVGGLLFPLSRIPQVPALALAADVLILAALAPVALTVRRP